ncbi:hypothetical protein SAMN05444166_2692 [Singulisphaera sp. GP187]|nr:hypothetical protein SAMN05444166_2692 [Singulisphaera sp. GP187]
MISEETRKRNELPCPTCGGRSYSWGILRAQGINFIPDEASLLQKAFRFGSSLRARRCLDCGNIQMFARSV